MDQYGQLHEIKDRLDAFQEAMPAVVVPALSAAVSLYILEFQQCGGITDMDVTRVQSYLQDIVVHGNDFLYASKKQGGTAERFNQVAEILAVLSFASGGVTVFGLHFEANTSLVQKEPVSGDETHPKAEQECHEDSK